MSTKEKKFLKDNLDRFAYKVFDRQNFFHEDKMNFAE
jgi:hypothetical protein